MKTTYHTGLAAEALCRLVLRLKGYRILESRYRSRRGEIDIIALRGKGIVAVEVKARSSIDSALESLSVRQQQRTVQAAQDFLAEHHRHLADYNLRFDVMLVVPYRWPKHIQDAWRPDSFA